MALESGTRLAELQRAERLNELKRLKAATEEILEALAPGEVQDAVNWADLRCVEAVRCTDQDGLEYLRVSIEEADPGAVKLQALVQRRLNDRGWRDVTVETEW